MVRISCRPVRETRACLFGDVPETALTMTFRARSRSQRITPDSLLSLSDPALLASFTAHEFPPGVRDILTAPPTGRRARKQPARALFLVRRHLHHTSQTDSSCSYFVRYLLSALSTLPPHMARLFPTLGALNDEPCHCTRQNEISARIRLLRSTNLSLTCFLSLPVIWCIRMREKTRRKRRPDLLLAFQV